MGGDFVESQGFDKRVGLRFDAKLVGRLSRLTSRRATVVVSGRCGVAHLQLGEFGSAPEEKPIADALKAVAREGLEVVEIQEEQG